MNVNWKCEVDGWTRVKCVPDSGAQVSVTPSNMVQGYDLLETAASKAGRGFTSASKHSIPNLGEYDLPVQSPEGLWTRQKWQVAPAVQIARPLLSVGEECDKEQFVIFGRRGGVVVDTANNSMRKFPRLENGAYEMEMWVPPVQILQGNTEGFTQQGAWP